MKKEFNKDEQKFNKIYIEAKNLTKKMSDTIDDFRNFFQPDKEIETFYINETINQAYLLLKKTLDHDNIQISFNSLENFKIDGYPNEFSHVLINIINNSRDALKNKKGKKLIFIKTEIFHDKTLKEYLHISIADNGGGIDNEIIDKIFEPYFTTKHQSSGTGIGLYMCKQIIESNMLGCIHVKNKNNGACFTIKIPL
jgi:signal transduction histidine kinase